MRQIWAGCAAAAMAALMMGCGGSGGDNGGGTPTPTPTATVTPTASPTPTPSPTPSTAITITAITPNTGGRDDVVTVTGTGFTVGNKVVFHFQLAQSTTVVNSTTLTAVVPHFRSEFSDPIVQDINVTQANGGAPAYPVGSGPINFTYTRFN